MLYWQWIRSHDLDSMFDLAREYAPYARVRSACEAAVDRLPRGQRIVIQERYYQEMTQVEIAAAHGVADSTIRNTHSQALGNLRRDDDLFSVLEAVGRVRDLARRNQLAAESDAALAA
jgi:DNA-directed RNA polymerase specialized sigma24 family protein